MTFLSARAVLSLFVLAGVVASCAFNQARGHPAATPQPTTDDQAIVDDPIAKLLQSRTPGLMITRSADGGIAVEVVQGPNSFYSNTQPLYLLDDVPFRPGAGGALIGINPYDIESIQLLRKPEDVGIYGVRGANGVIVIKTKKPGKHI